VIKSQIPSPLKEIKMTESTYKYDVAFSFLAQDEPLATELNDLLQDRFNTFLYSRRQGELAGTDGEKTFDAVFGEQARIVVVLYRKGWGESPWTRIEETAIRNRAYDHGYDFVKFIPLDDPPSVPKWLPRTQIWLGLKRWGIPATASVIEARIEECGGEPREESVQARAARLERSLAFNDRRERFLGSEEGVRAAEQDFGLFEGEFKTLIEEIKNSGISILFELKTYGKKIIVLGLNIGFSLSFRRKYINTLTDTELFFSIYDGHPPVPGMMQWDEPKQLCEIIFTFDLTPSEEHIWVSSSREKRQFLTKDLASFLFKRFMDEGLKQKTDK